MVEPEGKISRNKCADIVVRHVAVSPQSVNQTDKFRIQMYEEGDTEHPISRKEVLATLHPGRYKLLTLICTGTGRNQLRNHHNLNLPPYGLSDYYVVDHATSLLGKAATCVTALVASFEILGMGP